MKKRTSRLKYTPAMEKQIDTAFRKVVYGDSSTDRGIKRTNAAIVLARKFGTTVGAIKIKAHRLGW